MKNFTPRLSAQFLMFLSLSFLLPVSVTAQDANFINVPEEVTVEPDDTFTVRIDVQNGGTPVSGVEVHLDFDPAVLQIDDARMLATELPNPLLPITIDNNAGQFAVAQGILGTGVSTDFEFIEIDFRAVGTGNTTISYSRVFPFRNSEIVSGNGSILGSFHDIPVTIVAATEDPIASFTASPTSGTAALLVSVDASASNDPDGGNIVGYAWDFGDGNTATEVTADNNYTQPGTYTITLTVTDDEGEIGTSTQNITVDGIVITSYTVTASAGPNGSINPVSATVEEGGNQSFTISPDPGYEIAEILVGDTAVQVVNPFELTNVQSDINIQVSFALAIEDSVPEISLDAVASVNEGGEVIVPLLITDTDGDALTVSITSASNEPQELQSGNSLVQRDPYPFDAAGFLTESDVNDVDGSYSSNLVFAPKFGDGGSDGDGNGVYTITVSVTDTDGNNVSANLNLTVNDVHQLISDTLITIIEAESFDDQGPANSNINGDNKGIGVEDNTASSEGVVNIGFTNNGDFVEYLVDVATAGTYDFQFTVAKGGGAVGTMTINEEPTSSISVSPTGGWQSYITVSTTAVLQTGQQTLRFDWSGPSGFYFNIDAFVVTFVGGINNPPTIDAIADVDANEGHTVSVAIQVNDDSSSPTLVSIEIFDKSVGAGANTEPLTSGLTVPASDYTFIDEDSGSYQLIWPTDATDGRSYSATVTVDDTVNPSVSETFTIDLAQNISEGAIKATTFNEPVPFYGNNPTTGYSVSVETGNNNIGWVDPGEFVEYLIDVPAAGTYDMRIVASKGSDAGGNPSTMTISEDNGGFQTIGTLSVPNTGWTPFVTYNTTVSFSNAGVQKLRFDFGGSMNIQEFEFTPSTDNTPPIVDILTPVDGLSIEEGSSIEFTATASDIDDGDVSESLIWNSDIDGDFGTGAVINTSELSVGIHTITATATDNDASTVLSGSASVNISIDRTAPACDVRFRVNAGGALLTNSTGDFEQDQAAAEANGSAQTGTPSPYLTLNADSEDQTFGSLVPLVSNTTGYPDTLFQTERYSEAENDNNMKWAFPTGNGTFDVKILFNENWSGEIGQSRVFDVVIEDEIALEDYRPSGPDGADVNVAKVETYRVTVTDAVLNINFIKGTQNPAVKGFDICFVAPLSDTEPVVTIVEPIDGTVIDRNVETTFTATATDEEDDDTALTSTILWNTETDASFTGVGGTITDVLLNPGTHVIQARVTDSDNNTTIASVTVTVNGPEVNFTLPEDNVVLDSPEVQLEWTADKMLLTESFSEHFHLYVNPEDPDNLVPTERISTADEIGQLSWIIDGNDGILEGENTVVIVAAESLHTEFTNPEARDIVTFTVCSTTIMDVTATDPTECTSANGEITIEATGMNLEYSIDNGATYQAANIFSELDGGTYEIVVRRVGSSDCSATNLVTLTAPTAPTPIVTGPTSYVAGTSGVTLDAGDGYASYLWSNGETTQAVTVLAGTYSVTVTDANGCEGSSIGIVVTEEADTTPPEAICQSINIELNEFGVAGITAADIDNGSNDTSSISEISVNKDSFTCADLGENVVTLTVTDGNGNIATCNATVTVTDAIAPEITCPANIDMLSSSSQVLQIEAATAIDNCDGLPAISFVRSDDAELGLDDAFPQGITSIQWMAADASGNATGCVQTISITMPQSTSKDITAFTVDGQVGPATIDSNSAAVNLTVAVGTDLVSIAPSISVSDLASIDPASGTARNFSNSEAVPVIYTVTAEDGSTREWTVSMEEEEVVVPTTLSVTDFVLVNAVSDNDLFALTDGSVIDINTLPNLNLDVRANATDDVESVSFVLSGAKSRNATESVPPYALYGDSPTGNYNGSNFTVGSYVLTATPYSGNGAGGNQGTPLTINFELVDGDPVCLGVDVSVQNATDPSGCGRADGSIVLNITGATGNIDYDWGHDADLESATATGLPAGSYSVTVTVAGCTKTVSVDLTDPELASVTLAPFADVVSTASPITLAGGSPQGGTYIGQGVSNGNFDPSIGTGTYIITYTYEDPNTGCSGSATNTIKVVSPAIDSPLLVLDANTDTELFALTNGLKIQKADIGNTPLGIVYEAENNPGSVKFSMTGPINRSTTEGVAPYSLFGDIGVNIQGRVFSIGVYTLTVTPGNGPALTVSFEVTDVNPICAGFDVAVQSTSGPTTCDGSDGSVSLAVDGGAAPYTFSWNHDANLGNALATGLSEGTYSVTVTDANGCSETVSATLNDPTGPTVSLLAFDNVVDEAEAFALTGGSPVGGTYSGTGVDANGTFDPAVGAGVYTITYSYTDSSTGCDGSATQAIRVTSSSLEDSPLVVVDANTDIPLYELTDGLQIFKTDIGNTPLGIVYEPENNPSSVQFIMTGPLNRNYTEGKAPFSLYGDIGVDIQGRQFPIGNYTLTVNPKNGTAFTVNFSIVQGPSNTAKSAGQMTMFPNPAIEMTTVSFPEPVRLTQFMVYDVTGRLIKTIESDSASAVEDVELSVYDLPIGTYFVRAADTSGKGFQQRLIIEK